MTDAQKNQTKKDDPLRDKSFQMAARVVRLCKYLMEEKKEFVLSKQLLRSGTNLGSMVREAANAESGLDFVHKRGIAQKETGETQYWLEILLTTQYLNESEFQSIYTDTEEVMRLLKSSILTKKKNLALKARVVTIFIGMLTYAVF